VDPNHLHLHARDLERSRAFYERWFGLRERVRHGEILFLSSEEGFDLALAPDARPAPLPAWFHFGFRRPDAAEVAALHARMIGAGVPISRALATFDDYCSFTCDDPDGHRIEVYWEPA
jgi:catechol 2,3-dioxygenase-like lactoylglutathione lyase family enzyme